MPAQTSKSSRTISVELWEILGALIAAGVIILLCVLVSFGIGAKSEALRQDKLAAEASRPVDAVNAVLLDSKPVNVVDYITLPGQLQAWEKAQISSRVSGRVTKRLAEGKSVKKNDPVVYIDDRDYRINLADKKAAYQNALQTYERVEKLKSKRISSLSELEVAKANYDRAKSNYDAAQLSFERCIIRAPFDGVVDVVTPEIGELVDPGSPVATIAQMGKLKVEVGIPEKDVDLVRDVKNCEVVIDAAKTKVRGEKTYLSYLTAPGTQVYTLRLKIDNKDGKLRPGMFCKVKVVREIRKNFMVPIYSVLAKDDKHYVFIAGSFTPDPGKPKDPRKLYTATRRNVKLGVVQGVNVEILEGLNPGDKLVVIGQRNMDAGTVMNIQRSVENMGELSQ